MKIRWKNCSQHCANQSVLFICLRSCFADLFAKIISILATGETLAHLNYVMHRRLIAHQVIEGGRGTAGPLRTSRAPRSPRLRGTPPR